MTADRPLPSAMRTNDDIDWPVYSLMLSCRDLRGQRLPPTGPCSVIFGSVSWRQTWPNHDSLMHLTVHPLIDGLILMLLTIILLLSELFSCRNQQQFSAVFHGVVGILLHCLLADRCRRQTASCGVGIFRWTLMTEGCQFLKHLQLHHLQGSHSQMDAEISRLSVISFPRIY